MTSTACSCPTAPSPVHLCGSKHPMARVAVALLFGVLACVLGDHRLAWAALLQDQQIITVPISKSRILDFREPIGRVSVADPGIADILVINPKQLYLNGKVLGSTNMTLWSVADPAHPEVPERVIRQIGLEVTHDLEMLKEKLYRVLPAERIKVESAKGSVVLSGSVSSPERLNSALQLAKSYAGGEVINLLSVGGAQQVMLEVKVAEVNRTLGKSLDSQFLNIYDGGSVKIGLSRGWSKSLNKTDTEYLTSTDYFGNLPNLVENITGTGISSLINSGNFSAAFFLQMAEDAGQAKILAEPNLTTLSGQEAEFLSGGTFWITSPATAQAGNEPVPVDYGVKLKFIPLVMDSGRINLKVNVSVSEPGPPTLSGGAENQSLLSRGANATVEVPSGQVIAIAGLLNEKARSSVNAFPGLGDIPILGALFRSQEFQKEQTELVIFVTPRLANTFGPQQASLPTGNFIAPSDVDFYLMGKVSVRQPSSGSSSQPVALPPPNHKAESDRTGTESVFGHDL